MVGALRDAIEADDAATLRRIAHTIQGSVRLFGETPTARFAAQLESIGANGDCCGAKEQLADLELEMERLVEQLRQHMRASDDERE